MDLMPINRHKVLNSKCKIIDVRSLLFLTKKLKIVEVTSLPLLNNKRKILPVFKYGYLNIELYKVPSKEGITTRSPCLLIYV